MEFLGWCIGWLIGLMLVLLPIMGLILLVCYSAKSVSDAKKSVDRARDKRNKRI
ncbi:MAG: hypothetical protein J6J36_00450 [Clostridia bacterium]|nr:hypothetical protein [Clostridia bacterium]